jgi:iron complex outermembrane receptor protein
VRRYALRHGGDLGGANFSIDAAHFSTGGYRDHSRAERNTANAKLRVELAPQTRLTLVGNIVATPAIEDPLGLTAAQLAADPRQAGTGALLYNTRKSLVQEQVGAVLQVDLGEHDDVTLSTYAGHRRTTQFQAILQSVELASATHPGGVIDLARDYRGGELRFADRRSPFGTSLAVTGGITFDSLDEARRGYFNFVGSELGVLGSLRRDEANRVQGLDEFLQAEWAPAARWRLVGGVRHSDVRITSRNHLSLANPTAIGYAATNPVAGVTFRLRAGASLYASYGRGFETPTLNDLAYRSTNGSLTGLNTALQPARSDNYEIGAKVSAGEVRANFAAFQIRTENELAIKANSGGRSVLENIGATRRRGAELAVSASLPRSLTGTLAYTYLHARTLAPYLACAAVPCTPVTVPAGSRLPAVPASAVYAALAWHHPDERASIGVEVVGRSGIYADDRNLAFASGYWTTNLHLALRQTTAHWAFSEVVRLDNLFDRRYVGTVIVNESNGRYYEPSPGRTAYLLLNASFR